MIAAAGCADEGQEVWFGVARRVVAELFSAEIVVLVLLGGKYAILCAAAHPAPAADLRSYRPE